MEHVLCILAHDHPNLEFCPLIPPLCHLLAHFTSEPDDLLGLMVAIIKQNKEKSGDDSSVSSSTGSKANKDISDRCFYFPTGNKEFLLFNRGFGNLIYKNYRKVHTHIVSLHKSSIKPLWDKWISDMFVNILPQRALWRLLDLYMASGYRVLFQIGLALIDRFKNDILKIKTAAEFNDFFSAHSPALSTPKSLDELFNSAAKMYIKKLDATNLADHHHTLSNISTDDLVNMSSQRFQRGLPKFISSLVGGYNNKVDKSSRSGSPLSIRKKTPQDLLSTSTVIESDYWIALWSWIPPHKRMDSIELIFTTREHGTSISTLFQMTQGISPMILIIETTSGSVFGAYLSQPWQTGAAANGQFYGNGMSILRVPLS